MRYSVCRVPSRSTLHSSPSCSYAWRETSTEFIPWAFLLSTLELGSVQGAGRIWKKEREIGVFIHHSFIHSAEGHLSWNCVLSYSHTGLAGLWQLPPLLAPSDRTGHRRHGAQGWARVDLGRLVQEGGGDGLF